MDDLTIEELLQKAVYWEDMDQALTIMPAGEDGGVFLMRYDGTRARTAATLREALIEYIKENNREDY